MQCFLRAARFFGFMFFKKYYVAKVLICLNCDVVDIGDRANLLYDQRSRSAAAKYPVTYGEACAFRPQLVAMLSKYFPGEMKKWAETAVPGGNAR